MIFLLITLVKDYSYDRMSKVVSYYKNNITYSGCVCIGYKSYNYRSLPGTRVGYIYGNYDVCFGYYELPKRYIYSNMYK